LPGSDLLLPDLLQQRMNVTHHFNAAGVPTTKALKSDRFFVANCGSSTQRIFTSAGSRHQDLSDFLRGFFQDPLEGAHEIEHGKSSARILRH